MFLQILLLFFLIIFFMYGPIKINLEGKVKLEFIFKDFDHLENKFFIKLIWKSDYYVNIGETIYIHSTGRYKSFVDRNVNMLLNI